MDWRGDVSLAVACEEMKGVSGRRAVVHEVKLAGRATYINLRVPSLSLRIPTGISFALTWSTATASAIVSVCNVSSHPNSCQY